MIYLFLHIRFIHALMTSNYICCLFIFQVLWTYTSIHMMVAPYERQPKGHPSQIHSTKSQLEVLISDYNVNQYSWVAYVLMVQRRVVNMHIRRQFLWFRCLYFELKTVVELPIYWQLKGGLKMYVIPILVYLSYLY